ncbi:MAG: hypothetical protein IKP48_02975 [Bacteroidaceae bacterium]|nr:hypothetical protein [Bacteroidaceae bacterium]
MIFDEKIKNNEERIMKKEEGTVKKEEGIMKKERLPRPKKGHPLKDRRGSLITPY